MQQTVYIVDDDQGSRESICALVEPMNVRARAFESAEAFLDAFDPDFPGCLVTDLRMLGMSGMELLEKLHERGHRVPTIVLSGHADVPITVRAMQLGALTLLEKPCRSLELWNAIQQALELEQQQRDKSTRVRELQAKLATLTDQERQVLKMIQDGLPNKAIANRLSVSLRTVESRRKSIFEKTHTRTVAELIRVVEEAKQAQ
jgi:two-component system, LuxR family, response regulator FixJ